MSNNSSNPTHSNQCEETFSADTKDQSLNNELPCSSELVYEPILQNTISNAQTSQKMQA